MAGLATVSGYYPVDDLLETSLAARDHLYSLLLPAEGSLARTMCRILDSRASPRQPQPETTTSFQEVGRFSATCSNPARKGVGALQRPRHGAANLFSVPRNRHTPLPLHPQPRGAPWSPQDLSRPSFLLAQAPRGSLLRRRAYEAGREWLKQKRG